MTKSPVVYIDSRYNDGAIEREILTGRGFDLVLANCTEDEAVVAVAGKAEAILNTMYWMGPELFARLPNLKVVVRGGVGVDNIDVDAATEAGVLVCNIADYGIDEVANHAFTMLLTLNRQLLSLDKAARAGARKPPAELMPHAGRFAGETLGLVSFGNIARTVAKRATGFDMRIIAFDPFVAPEVAAGLGVELLPLDDVLSQADYISIHTPLTKETRGLIGARELALLKPSAFLVLTSRGGIIDEAALVEALSRGTIAGVGIDVWEVEPLDPANPLLQFDNVIATGHMAWYSRVSAVLLRQRFAEAAADVLDGVKPRSIINPAVLERFPLKDRPTA